MAKRGLGKGLGVLFGEDVTQEETPVVKRERIEKIMIFLMMIDGFECPEIENRAETRTLVSMTA